MKISSELHWCGSLGQRPGKRCCRERVQAEGRSLMVKGARRCRRVRPVVLYIDDSEDEKVLVQLAAESVGAEVEFRYAKSVAEGVGYLVGEGGAADGPGHPLPVLVLLDYHVGARTGQEFLWWLRAQPQFARLPVCVYSNADASEVIERSYAAGANEFLVKPRSFERLEAVVLALGRCAARPGWRLRGLNGLPEHRRGGGKEMKERKETYEDSQA